PFCRIGEISMLLLLRMIRWINRVKRRLFGRSLPHWVSDSLKFLSYFDFISFIPTSLVIALAPGHFFPRVPMIVRSKSSIYKTPIKFVTAGCALIVALGFLVAKAWDLTLPWTEKEATVAVVLILIATPAWIPVVCILDWLLLAFLTPFANTSVFRNEV